MSKPPRTNRTKLRETAQNDSRSDQICQILHCKLIQQGLADEVNLFEKIYEYGRYSHCDMAPDRDQPPVTNYAPVSPLGWDACGRTRCRCKALMIVDRPTVSFRGKNIFRGGSRSGRGQRGREITTDERGRRTNSTREMVYFATILE